ncbi:MAG TPA: peptide chain release factor N(5)-glutamine methyltransferase [Pyrinomonadaceae bacterium]|jgi:release factor glutamine methyltransferase|nr:peptide chain release factor N(5)-glutamine methyltransferase [Pyrinomonadaceae bacterium]
MNIADAIAAAAIKLADAGVAEPRREAASLMAFTLGRPSAFLIAHPEYELMAEESAAFEAFIARRASREPFQCITGRQEFWRLEFDVVPGVLIPRPETEILVEAAVNVISSHHEPRFIEAGVGSGCISVSILHSVPAARAIATDVSISALQLAAQNALKHGVAARLKLREADLFAGVEGSFDLIVSNPPYIPDGDIGGLQAEVRDFEPIGALAGGRDGLDIIRLIVADSCHLLRPGGVLIMEIGEGQAAAVKGLFEPRVWQTPKFLADLQAIDRVVIARTQTT